MSRRDPQELRLTEEVLEALTPADVRVLEQLDSLTIDTEDGPIDTTGTFEERPGDTIFSRALSVAPNVDTTVVSYSPSEEEAISGYTGNGRADGKWTLYLNGNEKASSWSNQANPNADIYFDNPINIVPGDTVELEVENVGLDTADFDGTIFIRL